MWNYGWWEPPPTGWRLGFARFGTVCVGVGALCLAIVGVILLGGVVVHGIASIFG